SQQRFFVPGVPHLFFPLLDRLLARSESLDSLHNGGRRARKRKVVTGPRIFTGCQDRKLGRLLSGYERRSSGYSRNDCPDDRVRGIDPVERTLPVVVESALDLAGFGMRGSERKQAWKVFVGIDVLRTHDHRAEKSAAHKNSCESVHCLPRIIPV